MRRLVALKTESGQRVYIHLDNWGGGVDRLFRRWMREHDGWRCLETGEMAHRTGLIFGRLSRLNPRPQGS
jgi:hypothetical protein